MFTSMNESQENVCNVTIGDGLREAEHAKWWDGRMDGWMKEFNATFT